MFGELGLVDGARRSATVRPVDDAELFEIDESTFDRLLSDSVNLPEFAPTLHQAAELRSLPPFASLGSASIAELLSRGRWISVAPDEVLVEQGDQGDAFYVIGSGRAEVLQNDEAIRSLGAGEHFGELALLMDIPRTASVVARTPMRVFELDREGFDEVVAGIFRRGAVSAVPIERTAEH
jgi:CRP-like cAMP-binding protein